MSISYSAITNYGKVTLPSVDTWGTNMNILKDPPKSITTRRIDKVGQTSDITEMIDESENRAAEAILPFARGVNPSVSVSYNNNSNNGGQGINPQYNTNAFLPYRIGEDFRPPVLTQYDLQPLSRLPRVWTSSFTQPGFVDFSKKMYNGGTAFETKEVKNELLQKSARPTAVYKIETPVKEPFEVKYVIQPFMKKSYVTKLSSTDRTTNEVLKPTKEVNYNTLNAYANSNLSDIRFVDNSNMYTNNYIQDTNNTYANTNRNSNIQVSFLDDMADFSNVKTRDVTNVNYITALRGNDKNDYIHDDIELGRTLPIYDAHTNIHGNDKIDYIHNDIQLDRTLPIYDAHTNIHGNDKIDYIHKNIELDRTLPIYDAHTNIHGNEKIDYIHKNIELDRTLPEYMANTNIKKNTENILKHEYMRELERNTPLTNVYNNKSGIGNSNVSSRDIKLNEKLQFGEYNGRSQIPNLNRIQQLKEPFETEKSKMGKIVMEQFKGIYQR